MVWIKCRSCGYGMQVTRQHGVPLAEYRCVICGGTMVRCHARPPVQKCYRELCNADVDGRTCAEGHEQPPH